MPSSSRRNPTVSYAFTVRATIGTVSPPRAYTLALTAVGGRRPLRSCWAPCQCQALT